MTSTVDLTAYADAMPPMVIDATVALTRATTMKAYEYWRAARGDRAMPARRDISPQGMREFVNNVGLIEVRREADGAVIYFVRLAGARIESVFGSITGRALGEFLPPPIEARWRYIFDATLAAKAPLRLTSRVAFQRKDYLAAECFLAPLGEGDDIALLLIAVDVWPVSTPA